jgi:hypothetical protein
MALLLLLWLLLVLLLLLLTRYYLSPKYTVIKVRPDQKRIVPIQNVLSKGFEAYCKEQIPTLEPPSGSSVVNWLGSRFGIGSAEGYTTIHPRKTDACVRACFFFANLTPIITLASILGSSRATRRSTCTCPPVAPWAISRDPGD